MFRFYYIAIFVFFISCKRDFTYSHLNFDNKIELSENSNRWKYFGNYQIEFDSVIYFSGKKSLLISSHKFNSGYGKLTLSQPLNNIGKELKITGVMKTKGINNGVSAIRLKIFDSNENILHSKYYKSLKNKDWGEIEVSLPLPDYSVKLEVDFILEGIGNAWFDEFNIFIDGKNIEELPKNNKPIVPAKLDKEFDAGSGIFIDRLTSLEEKNLFLLCKVWGFLKYYHPQIAKGQFNWDYELFRLLPNIKSKKFKALLYKYISNIKIEKERKINFVLETDPKLKDRFSWVFDTTFLGDDLSKELVRIINYPKEKSHYFLTFDSLGIPSFINEKEYQNMSWDDDGIKLLSLFRYWNVIEYVYPYRNLLNNWDEVLKIYIPLIIKSDDELSYKLTLLKLISEIEDTHSTLQEDEILLEYFGTRIIPAKGKIINNELIITENNVIQNIKNSLKNGDIITKINGVDIKKMMDQNIPFCSGSNKASKLRNIILRILRTNKKNVIVTVKRKKALININIKTEVFNYHYKKNYYQSPTEQSRTFNNNQIGYLLPGVLDYENLEDVIESNINKKGLIVDLRCSQNVSLTYNLTNHLLEESIPYISFTSTNLDRLGVFNFDEILSIDKCKKSCFKGKLIVLVDEFTQSSAETTAMALQTYSNTIILGSQTSGANGDISKLVFPGNISTLFSGIGVYYPNRSEIQRIGIIPNIYLVPNIEDIENNKDTLLEKAIDLIINKS